MNAQFYCDHPCFLSAVNQHPECFGKSIHNLLPFSVSFEALDTGSVKHDLVKQEAISNCNSGKWPSFVCILGLSSVLRRSIFTYYPDCGELKFKLLFNCIVQPRLHAKKSVKDLHILFCHEGDIRPGETFQPNHFVPLLFHARLQKRKLASSQTSIPAKKQKASLSCKKPLKIPARNISNFFTVEEKPFAKSSSQKKPNETFSSAASLAAHKLKQTSTSTISANQSFQKKSNESVPSATLSVAHSHKLNQPIKSASSPGTVTSQISSPLLKSVPHSISLSSGNVTSNFVHNFDVASYRERVKGMHSSEICELVRNVFKPDKDFSFPKTNGRSFRYNWLESYSWLCYSPSMDGAFCLSCVLFGDIFCSKATKINRLFSEPLRRWNDAAFTFKKHAGQGTGGEMGLHASTFPMLTALLAQMSGATQPIEVILDTNVKREIEENRDKLASIADAVLYCGRLGLPLRGHRDDSKYHPEVGQYSTGGVSNFIETLNLKVRSGDKVLENHLKTCGKNRSYISKTSQDKMIKCFGQVISETIVNDIKESKFFTIIADEAADSSHKEQMALVLRFVDKNMDIREEFIAFLQCK